MEVPTQYHVPPAFRGRGLGGSRLPPILPSAPVWPLPLALVCLPVPPPRFSQAGVGLGVGVISVPPRGWGWDCPQRRRSWARAKWG